MAGKRSDFFELIEQLDIRLSDFLVLFIVSLGERTAFTMADIVKLGKSS